MSVPPATGRAGGVRVGVTLPTFSADPTRARTVATAAEAAGLDGVFVLDHLWPMGRPGAPALWSFAVLGAVAATTTRVAVGTLVARVGLLSPEVHTRAFATLAAVAGPGRVIAGLGAGDRLSADENRAFGVGYPPAGVRLAAVASTVEAVRGVGVDPWVGGRSDGALAVARDSRATLNVWGASPEELAERADQLDGVALSWGGQVLVGRDPSHLAALQARYGPRPGLISGTVAAVAAELRHRADAGAGWCVAAPLDAVDDPLGAVETLSLVREAVQ